MGALLVVLALLAPSASAAWAPVYRFSARDGRAILDWRETGNGTLAFATAHEGSYLLFETVNATNARNSTLIRPLEGVERAALVTLKGRLGVLWSEDRGRDSDGREIHAVSFSWKVNGTIVRTEDVGILRARWDAVMESATEPVARVLAGRIVHVLDLEKGLFTGSYGYKSVKAPTKVVMLPSGDLHGIRWGLDGATYAFANATTSFETRFSTYWDYQAATMTVEPDGEIGVLLGDRREGCELWRGRPGEEWAEPKLLTRCPLVITESGFGTFHLTPTGLLAQVAGGFWDGRPDRVIVFTCSANFAGWTTRADGTQRLVGDGPSIWKRTPDPNFTIVADPAASAPTGLAVSFALDPRPGEGASATWAFGNGEGGRGIEPRHIYLAPGNFTVSVDVKTDSCTEGAGTIVSIPYRASGADLAARAAEETAKKPAFSAEDVNSTQQADTSFLPGPGAGLALVAVAMVAVALSRFRARAR